MCVCIAWGTCPTTAGGPFLSACVGAIAASNGWAQAGGEGATALGWGVVAGSEG